MLTIRVIPCLDVRDGRVVKGIRFDGLRDAGSPAERGAFYERQGADEIVLLDVAATPRKRATQIDTVRAVRDAIGIPLTVGGGLRQLEDAERLLEAGADRVALNTAAVREPGLIDVLARRFGVQCIVLALDARRVGTGWEVVVRSGRERTGIDAVGWARRAAGLGAGEILLTSWDRDGTRAGYDLALICSVSAAVSCPVIASGGASGPQDLVAAVNAGARAVLAASIFHDDEQTVEAVKKVLANEGKEVRP